jgi:hypothetical protein
VSSNPNQLERNIMSKMSKSAAARIHSAAAKQNGGQVSKGSFAARAQSAAAKSGLVARTPSAISKGGTHSVRPVQNLVSQEKTK